jgi:hypothetical protein
MENLQAIFSDPSYSMMASRAGLHPETYWQTLHPKAKEQHLSRVGAPPATYVTAEQHANSQAVGANSGPNAFISNNPVLAGYDGNPMQPGYPGSGPSGGVSPALSPSGVDTNVYTSPGALAAPEQDASMVAPGNPVAPVLSDPGAVGETAPVLSSQSKPAASSSSKVQSSGRAASPSTGNARGSQMGYGKANTAEMLMRVGGVMQANAVNGYGAAMGAASNEYGKIQDDRRAADTAAYEAEEATRLKEAAIRAASARSGGKGKGSEGTGFGSLASQAQSMNDIISRLKIDRNMTGPVAGTVGQIWDRKGFGDAERANLRLAMEGIALNEQLLFTAQTKGAITDREMAMFRKPIPAITDSEELWIAWLEPRAAVLNQLANNGISDAAAGGNKSPSTGTSDFNPADYTIVEIPMG